MTDLHCCFAFTQYPEFSFVVPGGNDGPSGVLVCSENFISYKHQRVAELRVPIPRRRRRGQRRRGARGAAAEIR